MQTNTTKTPANHLFDKVVRRSYRDVLNARRSYAPVGQIHRTSDKAEPGHIVLPGNGHRPSFVVSA